MFKRFLAGAAIGMGLLTGQVKADPTPKQLEQLVADYELKGVNEDTKILIHVPQIHMIKEMNKYLETEKAPEDVESAIDHFFMAGETDKFLPKIIKSQVQVYKTLSKLHEKYGIDTIHLEGVRNDPEHLRNINNLDCNRMLTLNFLFDSAKMTKIPQEHIYGSFVLRTAVQETIDHLTNVERNYERLDAIKRFYKDVEFRKSQLTEKYKQQAKTEKGKKEAVTDLERIRLGIDNYLQHFNYFQGAFRFAETFPGTKLSFLENSDAFNRVIRLRNEQGFDINKEKFNDLLQKREYDTVRTLTKFSGKVQTFVLGAAHDLGNEVKELGVNAVYLRIEPNPKDSNQEQ